VPDRDNAAAMPIMSFAIQSCGQKDQGGRRLPNRARSARRSHVWPLLVSQRRHAAILVKPASPALVRRDRPSP
jgi:hypothetical protein